MLDYIRKRSGGFISFFIIGAIALVFVFWGIGGQNTGNMSNIVLDDEKIPVYSYVELKRESIETLRGEIGDSNPDELNQLAARRALASITQRHILREMGKRTGRRVPDSELVRQITSIAAFQDDNGVFRKANYERYITQIMGTTVAAFESRLADDILVQNTAGFVEGLAFSPTKALLEEYHFAEDQIKLNYVYFPASAFTEGINPSEEEIAAYYEANKETFRIPAEIMVDYVVIKPESYQDTVVVTDEETKDFYDENLSRFTVQPQAVVSHILFKFPNFNPTPEEKVAVLQKAQEALKRLETEDFAIVAMELSEDEGTKSAGGSLGAISKGVTVKEFEDAAFGEGAQNLGEIIGPVETSFGYHLIKVDSVTPESIEPYDSVKDNLERQIRSRKARREAINLAEDLSDKAQSSLNTDLKTLAQSMNLECLSSDFFGIDNPPDFLKDPLEIQRAINSPLNVISKVVDVPETPDSPELLVIYMPTNKQESVIPPLEDGPVKDKSREGFIKDASLNIARETSVRYIQAAKESGFSNALDSFPQKNLDSGTTEFLPRLRLVLMTQPPVNAANPNELFEAIFQLAKTGDIADSPISVELPDGKGFLAISLADFQAANEALIEPNLEPRRQQAMDAAAQSAFALWSSEEIGKLDLKLPQEVQDDLNSTIILN
jgi:peptidyl-prolyl cis-trans isomerase D